MRVIREEEVARMLNMDTCLHAIRASFLRLAEGHVRAEPRTRIVAGGGYFATVCAADEELGLSSVKTYNIVDGILGGFVLNLTSIVDGKPLAIVEAARLTQLRTGAASGVAAAYLTKPSATSVGIIGCGAQAPFELDAVWRALPGIDTTVAWTRDPERLASFCEATGAQPAASPGSAAACDIVITSTSAHRPVLHGDWLQPGALVIAIGGTAPGARELDDDVLARAALVTCDSIATCRVAAADLSEPAGAGHLHWDDVVELQDVVAGRHPGRASENDIVVWKSNGLAAWDIAAAALLVADTGAHS